MFFVSFGSEVYTHEMIKEALKNKVVVVPKLKNNSFLPYRIDDFNELNFKNKYNILEPENYNKKIDKNKIDLVVVPGIAFDKKGHRIGYGKGYYDVFLSDMKSAKIGLAFNIQIVDALPIEEHDVKLNKVVTEKVIIELEN